jgi:DNA-binding protein H-NS
MSSLIDIQSQIQKLQKQAADIRTKEFDKTVQEIRDKMAAFGITLKDLQTTKRKPRADKGKAKVKVKRKVKVVAAKKTAAKKGKKAGSTVAAKYRGPNGETWSGRGLTPRWMAALVAQGRAKQEFAIKG